MLKRPHYIAVGLIVLLTLVILNLPGQTTARLKLGIGSLFLPLFGLASSTLLNMIVVPALYLRFGAISATHAPTANDDLGDA